VGQFARLRTLAHDRQVLDVVAREDRLRDVRHVAVEEPKFWEDLIHENAAGIQADDGTFGYYDGDSPRRARDRGGSDMPGAQAKRLLGVRELRLEVATRR